MKSASFKDLASIRIGHARNAEAGTGCTVIICDKGATPGVDVRGGAPGTRETDALDPVNLVDKVHAVVLSGGSAFGLDASAGVMAYLEEQGVGFDVGVTKVPIVAQAVLFDLFVGAHNVRPDKAMGLEACQAAKTCNPREGNIGAGTGACVGKLLGMNRAMKSGLGVSMLRQGDLLVGAVMAVNCLGDVVDPKNGAVLAGLLEEDKKSFASTEKIMAGFYDQDSIFPGNTSIGVVVTNAILQKSQATKIASMSHNGIARTMSPAHTMVDGDTLFVMATGEQKAEPSVVGMMAARAVEQAVVRSVTQTPGAYGLLGYGDLMK
ncbi:L-aminopeptidase/D-esterase [Desulfatibacillum alkenivorans DSM 16219]|jgi:L-aminopeptidase/D-esterase-like protein|uniref:L-aminopeptidase/D-esterase n=1 Tax=Desulfatibacillum alkenivorans DSM 16219 TaxID=1121393 RepID=A0A1M6C9E9_9BACT|nr:P1 family peptidase [Desulfatibacillum alkenivorans]SHI57642.1 L-aminopeptidase/D-esterase [Desulfatibacillum alkenivorans DSM 16219]